ncbi:lysophospholipase L1-like esterase [Melghirimyces profundicolus]|uniref:Lysophospholipase L1-like esterase n=1 Tax=Melghirimyces profundicolus TaxID=1242148 RepID=A0A2T6BQI5_9BACL|nr:GDSL-type esterase/lipase family protein [Melghirimyces profundicolus]PTX58309.1 lysophospholipase L1-like esterase [Melghirimyces profundicolus]
MKPVTYLALGDSLTEGVGADGPDSHFVAQHFCHMKKTEWCRLINMGISGLTSGELYELIQTPAIRKLIPRVSHMTITTGGCDFISWYEAGASLSGLAKTMRLVRDRVGRILRLVRELNPEVPVQLMGFYLPPPAYEMGFLFASRALKSMNENYDHSCRKYGAQMVNPFDSFLHRKDFFADEVHPNQNGYNVLARLFGKAIQPAGIPAGDQEAVSETENQTSETVVP